MEGSLTKPAPPEITIRPLLLSDIDDLMKWAADDRVVRNLHWNPFASKEEAINHFNSYIMPHPWYRAICLHDKAVGSVSVRPVPGDGTGHRANMGYAVAYEHWGKGIATAAVKKVAAIVFEEWPHLERLEAMAEAENMGSQRVLEKAGFKKEGLLRKFIVLKGKTRDVFMYSLIAGDPILP